MALSHVPDKARDYLHSENMTGEASEERDQKWVALQWRPGPMYCGCSPRASVQSGERSAVVRRTSARVPEYKRQARMTQSKRHAARRDQAE